MPAFIFAWLQVFIVAPAAVLHGIASCVAHLYVRILLNLNLYLKH